MNSTGIDITAHSTDTYLDKVYVRFENTTDNLCYNTSSSGWIACDTWNVLCSDGTVGGTDLACSNIATTITPSILDGKNYRLTIKSRDEAGNETIATPVSYVGDTTSPTLSVITASGVYFTGSLTISGTASDTGSHLSSIKIAIKKGSNWWNGTDWSATSEQQLATATSDGYAHWTYLFTPPLSETSGQSYNITVYAYDQAFKTNNSSSSSLIATIDTTAPTFNPTGFWIEPPFTNAGTGGIMRGGQAAVIKWNS